MSDLGPATEELLDVVRPGGLEFTRVEVPEDDIIAGAPYWEMGPVWTSADGSKMHGVTRMAPGRFWFDQPYHETTHILRGRMTITFANGIRVALQAGDIVHLQPGARWELEVTEMIEDSWTVSSANGPVSI